MGIKYSKTFRLPPEEPLHSLPSLISYNKNYSQLKPQIRKDVNINDTRIRPIEHVRQEPSDQFQQHPKPPIIENPIVIWLSSNINEDGNSIKQLQSMISCFQLFTDIDEFFAFIIEIKENQIFLIVSDIYAQKILSFIHPISQIIEIYVISQNKSRELEEWIKQYPKTQGIFTNIKPICEKLQSKLNLSEYENIPIEILNSSSFIIQYLIKQVLLYEIIYPERSKEDFITFARKEYPTELDIINEFQQTYTPSKSIWWYTRKSFLSSALNKVFQTENFEILFKMGFFIRDLHQEINRENTTIVYRGQGLLKSEFGFIKNTPNAILSFKNFLSTNQDRKIALNHAHLASNNPDYFGILFRLDVNSSTKSIILDKFSYYSNSDNDLLFSIYSLFRIDQIQQIETNLWQINLTGINYNDQQLNNYFKSLKTLQGQTAWEQLVYHFIQLNQYNKAEEICKNLIELNLINDMKKLALINQQLAFIYYKKTDLDRSILYYEKSLKIYFNLSSRNDSILFSIYLNLTTIHHKKRNFDEAIKYLKYALNIILHSSEKDHLLIANIYHHIGQIYEEQGIFLDAIQNYQSALEHELNYYPIHHVSITKTSNKIGDIFYQLEEYETAYSHYAKILQIQKKSLPPNHSSLARTNYNIARVLIGLQQYKEAIEYVSYALNIARHSFGSDHPDVLLYEKFLKKLRRKTLIGVIPNGSVYE